MSILIKGMEMPTIGKSITIYPDGRVVQYDSYTGGTQRGTAVTVPPHGRLIAEDDAIETAWMILAGLGYCREENPQLEQTVREVYATAPTVEVE